jgi:hypothetical protein
VGSEQGASSGVDAIPGAEAALGVTWWRRRTQGGQRGQGGDDCVVWVVSLRLVVLLFLVVSSC